jgi:hypothetical protein
MECCDDSETGPGTACNSQQDCCGTSMCCDSGWTCNADQGTCVNPIVANAIIGGSVGAAVIVIAVAACTVWCCFFRKRKQTKTQIAADTEPLQES